MACNRAIATMLRSRAYPQGLPGLTGIKAEKVVFGNALAEVSIRLARAQSLAGGQWTWEQPTTSLMWLFEPVRLFMLEMKVHYVTSDVCAFGAPWRKPTTLAATF